MNLFKQLEECNEGVFHFDGGEVCWTYAIQEGTDWAIRYESGWYVSVFDDGRTGSPGTIVSSDGTREAVSPNSKRFVKLFEPMSYSDAQVKYPKIRVGLQP